MKYFMTDIHGDARGMKLLLEHAKVNFSRDQIVFGGDMIDRGKESAEVVRFIKNLVDTYSNNVHALIGNHEEMMADYYRYDDKTWLYHGGYETIDSFNKSFVDETNRLAYIEWAYSLPMIFEDDQYVYTHAGLNLNEPLKMQSRDILWMAESDFYSIPRDSLLAFTHNKPIVHGHTPVEVIYFDEVRLNCDMGSNTNSVEGESGLGLVNLTEMCVYVYMQGQKKIEERRIGQI